MLNSFKIFPFFSCVCVYKNFYSKPPRPKLIWQHLERKPDFSLRKKITFSQKKKKKESFESFNLQNSQFWEYQVVCLPCKFVEMFLGENILFCIQENFILHNQTFLGTLNSTLDAVPAYDFLYLLPCLLLGKELPYFIHGPLWYRQIQIPLKGHWWTGIDSCSMCSDLLSAYGWRGCNSSHCCMDHKCLFWLHSWLFSQAHS